MITILAQIGCFVPAKLAIIPLRDRILSRLGSDDDIEHNISTFAMEMKETAYILDNITRKSLVIIDELGRGTSNIDGKHNPNKQFANVNEKNTLLGMAMAISVAEKLIEKACYCLIVTHFPQLTLLSQIYVNVGNIHLKATLQWDNQLHENEDEHNSQINTQAEGVHIKFTREIIDGPSDLDSGYGILMSQLFGLPTSIVQEAKHIHKDILETTKILFIPDISISPKVELTKKILQRTAVVLDNLNLPDEVALHQLHEIRHQLNAVQINSTLEFLQTVDSSK